MDLSRLTGWLRLISMQRSNCWLDYPIWWHHHNWGLRWRGRSGGWIGHWQPATAIAATTCHHHQLIRAKKGVFFPIFFFQQLVVPSPVSHRGGVSFWSWAEIRFKLMHSSTTINIILNLSFWCDKLKLEMWIQIRGWVNLEHWFIARGFGRSTCNFFKSLSF